MCSVIVYISALKLLLFSGRWREKGWRESEQVVNLIKQLQAVLGHQLVANSDTRALPAPLPLPTSWASIDATPKVTNVTRKLITIKWEPPKRNHIKLTEVNSSSRSWRSTR